MDQHYGMRMGVLPSKFLPPPVLQRIPTKFPQDSPSIGQMGMEVSVTETPYPKSNEFWETYRACILILSDGAD